uniref:Pco117051 n=1 Tax=Arundo donax TaxID=35708 RepID=A0A0A9GA48_ARUDO
MEDIFVDVPCLLTMELQSGCAFSCDTTNSTIRSALPSCCGTKEPEGS